MKITLDEIIFIVLCLTLLSVIITSFVILFYKAYQEDRERERLYNIKDTIKNTKKRIDKETKRYEKQIKNKNNERNNKR